MIEARIGNDVAVVWTIKKREGFVSLFERNLTLELHYGQKTKVMPFRVIADNKIAFSYYGKDHEETGIHALTLWQNKGLIGEGAVDALAVFKLVPWSTMVKHKESSADNLEVTTVEIETEDIEAGIRGLNAYELALLNGFEGTEKEWLDSLGKPARDAAAGLDAKFKKEVNALKTDYDGKIKALADDYKKKSDALSLDYKTKTESLEKKYSDTESKLSDDYSDAKSKIESDYANAVEELSRAYEASKIAFAEEYTILLNKIAEEYAQKQKELKEASDKVIAENKTAIQKANTSAENADTKAKEANEAKEKANNIAKELKEAKERGDFNGEPGLGLSESEHAQLVKEVAEFNNVKEQVGEAKQSAAKAEAAAISSASDLTKVQQALQQLPDGQAVTAMVAEHTIALNDLGLKTDEVKLVIERVVDMVLKNLGNLKAVTVDSEDGYKVCGVPTILYGEGAPSATVRPTNLPDDIPWDGYPFYVGQQYINVSATSSGMYYAINNTAVSGWKQA